MADQFFVDPGAGALNRLEGVDRRLHGSGKPFAHPLAHALIERLGGIDRLVDGGGDVAAEGYPSRGSQGDRPNQQGDRAAGHGKGDQRRGEHARDRGADRQKAAGERRAFWTEHLQELAPDINRVGQRLDHAAEPGAEGVGRRRALATEPDDRV